MLNTAILLLALCDVEMADKFAKGNHLHGYFLDNRPVQQDRRTALVQQRAQARRQRRHNYTEQPTNADYYLYQAEMLTRRMYGR